MQLLVLKLLYLLFRTEGMSEYFYTNDLCVLVDVFLREIGNIDEDNESVCPVPAILCIMTDRSQLRHTYLRVLHPLLTKTQLRSMPYIPSDSQTIPNHKLARIRIQESCPSISLHHKLGLP